MKLAIIALTFAPSVALAAKIPAWCSALGDARMDWSGSVKDAYTDEDPRNALRTLVAKLCKPDDEVEDAREEIEAAKKRWSQRLDLTEADWADVALYATLDQSSRMSGDVALANDSDATRKRPWSSFDPIDQYVWLTTPMGASDSLTLDHDYLADAFGAKLSEVGRLAYVAKCVRENNAPVQWAMCQGDVEKLDPKKIVAELRDNKVYGGHQKIRIRIELDATRKVIAEQQAKVKQLIASDPGYAKVFEVAAAARKEWDTVAQPDTALLDLVARMDDARTTRSRKAFEGCEDATWAAWKTAMGRIPAKAYAGKHDDRAKGKMFLEDAVGPIIGDARAYLASVAMVTCYAEGREGDAPKDLLIRNLGNALERWPGFRGPRTAAQTAIMQAGITLDDRDARLEYPMRSRPFAARSYSTGGGGSGVIAKLKPNGKLTNVEFVKQMVRQVQCAESRETNHVVAIRSDGQLQYQWVCLRNETVTVNKADDPQNVNPRYLEGVKPGMFVSVIEDVAVAVWAKPDADTPIMVFGVPLK